MWNLLSDKMPEVGTLCVIEFKADGAELMLVYVDDQATWEERNSEDMSGMDPLPNSRWFSSTYDPYDMYDGSSVRAWKQIERPQR